MPRRKITEKRTIDPDPRFNSVLVSKFTHGIMERGKKSVAQKIFYGAMDIISEQVTDVEPIAVFDKAMEMVRPKVEVKSRRVGGATYQVPVEVRPERRNALAIRWIISFAKARSGKTMPEKLAAELLDAYNEAFAHYRW
jgi:small subunit ribosomal protein S7